LKRKNKMKEIIKIFENSMSLTITTIIAAIGVGLNVWFNKKAMGDPQREELIKSKFEIYKDMYLQIVLIKRSHCLNKSASEIDEIIKNYYKNLIENERDKLVLLDGRTINLFEDIFNEKHTNNTNTERTGNTEADSEKRWEQSMRSYKKYKLESNIKKEYEKLKRRMKYPVHYVRHIIANIGPFGMIICTTGLWSLSEKGLTDHSWIVLAFIIGEVIGMIITIYNIGYVGEY
jgi:hypothetical protein